jgi:ABC-type enterochelin transport system substrate-binding protein
MPQLKLRTFLREYSGGTLHFNNIKFQVVVHIDNMYCKIQYIPKTSNELVKLNNVYGKEKIAKKIKEHLEKTLGIQVNYGDSHDAGLSFTTLTGHIEDHILTMIS